MKRWSHIASNGKAFAATALWSSHRSARKALLNGPGSAFLHWQVLDCHQHTPTSVNPLVRTEVSIECNHRLVVDGTQDSQFVMGTAFDTISKTVGSYTKHHKAFKSVWVIGAAYDIIAQKTFSRLCRIGTFSCTSIRMQFGEASIDITSIWYHFDLNVRPLALLWPFVVRLVGGHKDQEARRW